MSVEIKSFRINIPVSSSSELKSALKGFKNDHISLIETNSLNFKKVHFVSIDPDGNAKHTYKNNPFDIASLDFTKYPIYGEWYARRFWKNQIEIWG
mgnify:CR=1 FL=1